MARHFVAGLVLLVCMSLANAELRTRVNRAWAGGMQGIVKIPIEATVTGGWHIVLEFDYNIFEFETCAAEVLDFQEHMTRKKNRSQVIIGNRSWNADLAAGETLEFKFLSKTWIRRKGFTGTVEFVPSTWGGDVSEE